MGAGKSFISRIFKEYGYVHFDVDKIAKNVIDKSLECKYELKDFFGEDILDGNLNLNREILGLKAFDSAKNLLELGRIVNSYIKSEVERLIFNMENKIVIDAATLFKSGLNEFCRYKIYVTASLDIRCKRISERDKISKEVVIKRVLAQREEIFFKEKCDFILDTSLEEEKVPKKISEMIIQIESI